MTTATIDAARDQLDAAIARLVGAADEAASAPDRAEAASAYYPNDELGLTAFRAGYLRGRLFLTANEIRATVQELQELRTALTNIYPRHSADGSADQ